MLSIVAPIQCNTHSDQNGDEVSLLQKSLKLEEHPKVIATIMKQVKDNLDGNVDPDGNEGKLESVKDMLGDKISQLQGDSKVIATDMEQVKYNLDGNEDPDGNEGKLRENVKDMLGDKISQVQEDAKANGY